MKILGVSKKKEGYRDVEYFIAEVSMDEIIKVANKSSYRGAYDEIRKSLHPGMDYPIADGYDFRAEIKDAVVKMEQAHVAFAKAAQSMAKFAALFPRDEA